MSTSIMIAGSQECPAVHQSFVFRYSLGQSLEVRGRLSEVVPMSVYCLSTVFNNSNEGYKAGGETDKSDRRLHGIRCT